MMKIYLDACCLKRLTDDQSQRRIREEAEAVELILRRSHAGELQWISSEALTDEINRNPHLERRLENAALLWLANQIIEVDQKTAGRAKDLEAAGYGAFDALHLACAEAARLTYCYQPTTDLCERLPVAMATLVLRSVIQYPGARKACHEQFRYDDG
jgi:hypothetical protein